MHDLKILLSKSFCAGRYTICICEAYLKEYINMYIYFLLEIVLMIFETAKQISQMALFEKHCFNAKVLLVLNPK